MKGGDVWRSNGINVDAGVNADALTGVGAGSDVGVLDAGEDALGGDFVELAIGCKNCP